MRVKELILLAFSSACATTLTTNTVFESKNFSVSEALEHIGIPIARLPAPKLNLAALGEGHTSTSCTLAASAGTNKRRKSPS